MLEKWFFEQEKQRDRDRDSFLCESNIKSKKKNKKIKELSALVDYRIVKLFSTVVFRFE